MIPIGSAYSAGTLTLRSGSVIVAEELLSEGAGFAVSKAGEAMDLNLYQDMNLKLENDQQVYVAVFDVPVENKYIEMGQKFGEGYKKPSPKSLRRRYNICFT